MINLKELRKTKGFKQKDVADFLGITQQAYANYERSERQPNNDTIVKLADYFNVTVDYLLGRDDAPRKTPQKGVRIPVLGKVQAGIPVDAIEEIIDYEEITQHMASQGEFFGLIIRGESMQPRMLDGDVIIVRKQSDIDSGDIAVVLVNGNDATVKRVVKSDAGIKLVPFNSAFDVLFFTNEEIETLPVSIIGKVVELRGKF